MQSIKSKGFFARSMLPSCVSLACAVNYLNLKAVPYTIPFKGQIAGFNPVFWPLMFHVLLWFSHKRLVSSAKVMSPSLLHSFMNVLAENVDQRLIIKVNSLARAVSSTFKPDYSEEVMLFVTHRKKGNCILLPILHSSWK